MACCIFCETPLGMPCTFPAASAAWGSAFLVAVLVAHQETFPAVAAVVVIGI